MKSNRRHRGFGPRRELGGRAGRGFGRRLADGGAGEERHQDDHGHPLPNGVIMDHTYRVMATDMGLQAPEFVFGLARGPTASRFPSRPAGLLPP